MIMPFRQGDRVRFSEEAKKRFPQNSNASKMATVAYDPQFDDFVAVVWDGDTIPHSFATKYFEPA